MPVLVVVVMQLYNENFTAKVKNGKMNQYSPGRVAGAFKVSAIPRDPQTLWKSCLQQFKVMGGEGGERRKSFPKQFGVCFFCLFVGLFWKLEVSSRRWTLQSIDSFTYLAQNTWMWVVGFISAYFKVQIWENWEQLRQLSAKSPWPASRRRGGDDLPQVEGIPPEIGPPAGFYKTQAWHRCVCIHVVQRVKTLGVLMALFVKMFDLFSSMCWWGVVNGAGVTLNHPRDQ